MGRWTRQRRRPGRPSHISEDPTQLAIWEYLEEAKNQTSPHEGVDRRKARKHYEKLRDMPHSSWVAYLEAECPPQVPALRHYVVSLLLNELSGREVELAKSARLPYIKGRTFREGRRVWHLYADLGETQETAVFHVRREKLGHSLFGKEDAKPYDRCVVSNKYAVKLFSAETATSRIRHEYRMGRRVRFSPYCVSTYRLLTTNLPQQFHSLAILMECCMLRFGSDSLAGSLAELKFYGPGKAERLRRSFAASVVPRMYKALKALKYPHGDIKPANILWRRTRRGREMALSDFGTCNLETVSERPEHTRHYAAPEVREGKNFPTHASDVYSLAATVFEVLFGSPPAGADSRIPSFYYGSRSSRRLVRTLRRALLPDPEERPSLRAFCSEVSQGIRRVRLGEGEIPKKRLRIPGTRIIFVWR